MNATILHESRGRFRLRLAMSAMTLRQADLLEAWLQRQTWTTHAVVHERTAHLLCDFVLPRRAPGGLGWSARVFLGPGGGKRGTC